MIACAVAATVFGIAFTGGAYDLQTRGSLAIVLLWALIISAVLGILPRTWPDRPVLAVAVSLGSLALITGASSLWTPNAEAAVLEFNRVTLYLAAFVLIAVGVRSREIALVADGLAVGVSTAVLTGLLGRIFPTLFSDRSLFAFFPSAQIRLSFPVGYWNGVAALIALACPLLLRRATASGSFVLRGLAVAPFPALAAALYLTSSRGGLAAAAAAVIVFLVLSPAPWASMGALCAAGLGSAVSIWLLVARPAFVNDPSSSQAAAEGRSFGLLILLVCAATGALYAVGARSLHGRVRPRPRAARATLATALVLAAGLVALADPVDRFRQFKQPPPQVTTSNGEFVRSHLLDTNGSGRWQMWEAALSQFREHPLLGEGAGTYEAWWAQHGSIRLFARDAHSVYLETLGELGIVGLACLLALVTASVGLVFTRLRRAAPDQRTTVAGLSGVLAAFAVAAGVDWMWELTVVALVAVIALGLVAAVRPSPTEPSDNGRVARAAPDVARSRFAAVVTIVAVAWVVLCIQALPLLAHMELANSRDAVARSDFRAAARAAEAARRLSPWAPSPYLQLALVAEERADLDSASAFIDEALSRGANDWRLWLVSARIETKRGQIDDARASLARARALNPRSPLFAER